MSRAALLALLLGASALAHAQPGSKPKQLCFLTFDQAMVDRAAPFFTALRKIGYVDKSNIVIHYMSANGDGSKFPELAQQCVKARVDVIVPQTTPAAQAAKKATSTIPIVMLALGDPVGSGLITSFARPGGNVTGPTFNVRGLASKRLELIKEVLPNARTVLVLSYLTDPIAHAQVEELTKGARAMNVELIVREVKTGDDVAPAMEAGAKAGAQAMMVTHESFFFVHATHVRVVELARKYKLPGVFPASSFVESGGLMSFTANFDPLWERSADYVVRVLKGAKPSDLPIVQPDDFVLTVNMKTAKDLGIAVPKSVLVRAARLIE